MVSETATKTTRHTSKKLALRLGEGDAVGFETLRTNVGKVITDDVELNRKVLADIAVNEPKEFIALVEQAAQAK